MKKLSILLFPLLAMNLTACKKERETIIPAVASEPIPVGTQFSQEQITEQEITVNPSGYAPLTASIGIKTDINTRVEIRVLGKNGERSDITKSFSVVSKTHKIPVFGLYADHNNIVHLTLYDEQGRKLGTTGVYIQTQPLNPDLPKIQINVPHSGDSRDLHLTSYYGHSGTATPQEVFIFDVFGDIRWYLDFTNHSVLNKLHYQDGVERLRNGNLYFADMATHTVYEVDFFGEIKDAWPMPGYQFHHHVLELPNGNFLVTVTKEGISTINDFIIEIDRNSKQIVNVWDLRESLQPTRKAWTNNERNWIHVNAVEYDPSDDCIILSGRNQGVAKLTRDNKVKWILSTHNGWDVAGDGTNLADKLLQPLAKNGTPITDTAVLNGHVNHPEFEWNWYQHAPKLQADGNILLFDNGDNRNFTGAQKYSRAVEFKIDEQSMTVQQVWQYGKERGQETFSNIVSDVDYYSNTNTVVFTPGSITWPTNRGKVIEVNKNSGNVVFEATVLPPTDLSRVTMHRTDKITLY